MKSLIGIGVSVGVLAGAWTQVSVELELVTWVAFVAWACFFAAGGGVTGLRQGLAANLAGLFWAWVVSQVVANVDGRYTLALAVTVLGFVLCVQAALPLLAFIPGAFVGAAAFFGTGFDTWPTVLALVVGGALGITSEVLGNRIQAFVPDDTRTQSQPTAVS